MSTSRDCYYNSMTTPTELLESCITASYIKNHPNIAQLCDEVYNTSNALIELFGDSWDNTDKSNALMATWGSGKTVEEYGRDVLVRVYLLVPRKDYDSAIRKIRFISNLVHNDEEKRTYEEKGVIPVFPREIWDLISQIKFNSWENALLERRNRFKRLRGSQ